MRNKTINQMNEKNLPAPHAEDRVFRTQLPPHIPFAILFPAYKNASVICIFHVCLTAGIKIILLPMSMMITMMCIVSW